MNLTSASYSILNIVSILKYTKSTRNTLTAFFCTFQVSFLCFFMKINWLDDTWWTGPITSITNWVLLHHLSPLIIGVCTCDLFLKVKQPLFICECLKYGKWRHLVKTAHAEDSTVPGGSKSETAQSKTVQFSTNYTSFLFLVS